MQEYRTRISENGRMIIPAHCRQQLHLHAGDELIIRIENDEMRIYSIKHALKKAQEIIKKHTKGKNLVEELKKMRRVDFDNE